MKMKKEVPEQIREMKSDYCGNSTYFGIWSGKKGLKTGTKCTESEIKASSLMYCYSDFQIQNAVDRERWLHPMDAQYLVAGENYQDNGEGIILEYAEIVGEIK